MLNAGAETGVTPAGLLTVSASFTRNTVCLAVPQAPNSVD